MKKLIPRLDRGIHGSTSLRREHSQTLTVTIVTLSLSKGGFGACSVLDTGVKRSTALAINDEFREEYEEKAMMFAEELTERTAHGFFSIPGIV